MGVWCPCLPVLQVLAGRAEQGVKEEGGMTDEWQGGAEAAWLLVVTKVDTGGSTDMGSGAAGVLLESTGTDAD